MEFLNYLVPMALRIFYFPAQLIIKKKQQTGIVYQYAHRILKLLLILLIAHLIVKYVVSAIL